MHTSSRGGASPAPGAQWRVGRRTLARPAFFSAAKAASTAAALRRRSAFFCRSSARQKSPASSAVRKCSSLVLRSSPPSPNSEGTAGTVVITATFRMCELSVTRPRAYDRRPFHRTTVGDAETRVLASCSSALPTLLSRSSAGADAIELGLSGPPSKSPRATFFLSRILSTTCSRVSSAPPGPTNGTALTSNVTLRFLLVSAAPDATFTAAPTAACAARAAALDFLSSTMSSHLIRDTFRPAATMRPSLPLLLWTGFSAGASAVTGATPISSHWPARVLTGGGAVTSHARAATMDPAPRGGAKGDGGEMFRWVLFIPDHLGRDGAVSVGHSAPGRAASGGSADVMHVGEATVGAASSDNSGGMVPGPNVCRLGGLSEVAVRFFAEFLNFIAGRRLKDTADTLLRRRLGKILFIRSPSVGDRCTSLWVTSSGRGVSGEREGVGQPAAGGSRAGETTLGTASGDATESVWDPNAVARRTDFSKTMAALSRGSGGLDGLGEGDTTRPAPREPRTREVLPAAHGTGSTDRIAGTPNPSLSIRPSVCI
mmetsp:Transcript_17563/g.34976  ORF Transcript_17563/g.34976 Transcript_17563/m.34976 type:complete len:543 (-) Transcript_17563:846-2474(-)